MSNSIAFVLIDGGLLPGKTPDSGSPLRQLVPARGALAGLRRLSEAGFGIVLLGDAVAPGLDTRDVDAYVKELLAAEGIAVTAWKQCTHRPAACDCAPPGLGLVRDYLADAALDRRRSFVVGRPAATGALAANMGLAGFEIVSGEADAGWPAVVHAVLDAPRTASVVRRTRETQIDVEVDLDRPSAPSVDTGIGFFDHMLEQLGKHGGFALSVACNGDLDVDEHHTVEDVALAVGEALRQALGAKLGIGRYGFVLPMDEARAEVSIDLSGRAYFVFEGSFDRESVGGLPTELVPHFFRSLADALGATLHLTVIGDNDHHKIEASFKGVARALRQAIRREGDDLPSTKGAL